MKRLITLLLASCVVLALTCSSSFAAKKPNILVIWGDDVGQTNISATLPRT